MLLMDFLRDERGAVSVEYGLILSVVAFAFVTGLRIAAPRLGTDPGQVASTF